MLKRTPRTTVVAGGVLGAAALLRALGPQPALLVALTRQPQGAVDTYGPDVVALALCGLLAWLVLGWLALGLLLTVTAQLPGAAGSVAGSLAVVALPTALRRTIGLALGLSLVAGAGAGTVSAAAVPERAQHRPAASLDLDWPMVGTARTPAMHRGSPAPARTRTPVGRPVVVIRGDTLWAIAARHLPVGASNAEVAAQWPRWYDANRHVIGDNPDLIRPGQILHAPATQSPISRRS